MPEVMDLSVSSQRSAQIVLVAPNGGTVTPVNSTSDTGCLNTNCIRRQTEESKLLKCGKP